VPDINPLQLFDPSVTSNNPLQQGAPSLGQALNTAIVDPIQQWVAAERARSIQMGLMDPKTGLPTTAGLVDAAKKYASGLLAGTTAPGEVPGALDVPGVADRISTRVPTAKGQTIDPHATADLTVGLPSSQASGDAYSKNADIISGYSDIPTGRLRNADSISQKLIGHLQDNLSYLYNAIPPEIRDRSMQWYDGANTIAQRWADQFGLSPRAVAGTMASLSPQKDWFQNVDLARRVLQTRADQGAASATPEMLPFLQRYVDMQKVPQDRERLQGMVDDFRNGKTLGELTDPLEQALWIRAFDEAHNPRSYPVVTPEGEMAGIAMTGSGTPQRVGWGSFKEIAKANSVLNDDSLSNISQAMGGNHKVRNFYNNIISPDSPHGDVTIDTHAIAAGHMRPLSGSDPEVSNGLGLTGSASAATGSRGLYGLYAEAYRRAAADAGILPRQMQSVTWEGIRGLFSPEQKRNANLTGAVNDIWNQYGKGAIDAQAARDAVTQTAGGINAPEWWRPNP
jgi:hypothetical protein